MDRVNVVIIGGGVVGCAVARAVSAKYDDVFLLEHMPRIGMGASTRNSGVIHAGLYYTPGSLKARHCVRGNALTYEFCAAHGVPHRRTGKIVVASTPEEELQLMALVKRAEGNGVSGYRMLDRAEIRAREPHVEGRMAMLAPSSGIVSSEELVKAYARVAAEQGANMVLRARVRGIEPLADAIRVTSEAGTIEARVVVNCAGLYADEVAALAGNKKWKIYPVRGEYCEVVKAKSNLVNALVYPLPHEYGLSLGLHLTKTLWGTVLVGPTARYIEKKDDYERDLEPVESFARGAKTLLPEIEAPDLTLAYSGIRAKLTPPDGAGMADFVIERDGNVPRMIQCVGIDSPGLTAAGAIAEQVEQMATEVLR